MKCVLVWLAVMTTTFHTSQAQCWNGARRYENGVFIVRGIGTTNLTAGYIEICVGDQWRTVCDDGWDRADAIQMCRILGFMETYQALHCGNSCLGNRRRQEGIRGYWTNDTHHGWSVNTTACEQNAGIFCHKLASIEVPDQPMNFMMTLCQTLQQTDSVDMAGPATTTRPGPTQPQTEVPTCPNTTCPTLTSSTVEAATCPTCPTPIPSTVETTDAATGGSDMVGGAQQSEPCPSLAALGGGLGGLCVILLVGVVMGWVLFCFKRREKPAGFQESSNSDQTFANPTYNPTSPNFLPSVQYSTFGPRGTPHTHTPPSSAAIYDVIDTTSTPSQPRQEEERMHQVLGGPQEGREEGEGVYHLLGEV